MNKTPGIALLFLLLVSCTVGPNFKTPPPPSVHAYVEGKAPDFHFYCAKNLPQAWWQLYQSEKINAMIECGLKNSPTIDAARAALSKAEHDLKSNYSALFFPAITANGAAEREKFSASEFGVENTASSIFNLYTASFNVSYNFDLFGRSRRIIEGLCAQVDYQRYQLEAAQMNLAANIATTAITQAAWQEKIKAQQALVVAQEKTLDLLRQMFELGGANYSQVLAQETLVAQTRASLYPLEKGLAQSRHALAMLTGEFPSDNPFPYVFLNEIRMPQALPLVISSQLVKQRPDVRSAVALLHQASANVGVATADFFPQINLTGSYGWESNEFHHLFSPGNNIWSYAAQVAQPLFNGAQLIEARKRAKAAYDLAFANYRQSVLVAFQQVADGIRAVEKDDKAYTASLAAEQKAKESLDMVEKQFKLGAVNYLDVMQAEIAYQNTIAQRIAAQSARLTDVAALFEALGGPWWCEEKQK